VLDALSACNGRVATSVYRRFLIFSDFLIKASGKISVALQQYDALGDGNKSRFQIVRNETKFSTLG
jgi:hypothetical protein